MCRGISIPVLHVYGWVLILRTSDRVVWTHYNLYLLPFYQNILHAEICICWNFTFMGDHSFLHPEMSKSRFHVFLNRSFSLINQNLLAEQPPLVILVGLSLHLRTYTLRGPFFPKIILWCTSIHTLRTTK